MSRIEMMLWRKMWETLLELRGGFERKQTFLWFVVAVAGFCTRTDLAGVSSFIRGSTILWLGSSGAKQFGSIG
jgi:hypothetical protein